MPRYFFRTTSNDQVIEDSAGAEFASEDKMRAAAIRTLPMMALDELPDGATHEFAIDVSDEAGEVIFRATLSFKSSWLRSPR